MPERNPQAPKFIKSSSVSSNPPITSPLWHFWFRSLAILAACFLITNFPEHIDASPEISSLRSTQHFPTRDMSEPSTY